jgi:signal peptidase I
MYSDKEGVQYLLTKGDNNNADDRGLYNPGQMWVKNTEVIGRVKGFLPYVGCTSSYPLKYLFTILFLDATIIMTDYPWLKAVLLAVLGVMTFMQKEEV